MPQQWDFTCQKWQIESACARATAMASMPQHSAAYGSPCSNISSVYMCFDHLIHGSVNRTVPRLVNQVVLQVHRCND